MSKRQYWDSVIVVSFGLITLVVALSLFTGCSVKILTFGTENESVDKEYFIGTKKGE